MVIFAYFIFVKYPSANNTNANNDTSDNNTNDNYTRYTRSNNANHYLNPSHPIDIRYNINNDGILITGLILILNNNQASKGFDFLVLQTATESQKTNFDNFEKKLGITLNDIILNPGTFNKNTTISWANNKPINNNNLKKVFDYIDQDANINSKLECKKLYWQIIKKSRKSLINRLELEKLNTYEIQTLNKYINKKYSGTYDSDITEQIIKEAYQNTGNIMITTTTTNTVSSKPPLITDKQLFINTVSEIGLNNNQVNYDNIIAFYNAIKSLNIKPLLTFDSY